MVAKAFNMADGTITTICVGDTFTCFDDLDKMIAMSERTLCTVLLKRFKNNSVINVEGYK